MYAPDRTSQRRLFCHAWSKAQRGEPLEPVEAQIVQVARLHPEYEPFLAATESNLTRDFPPESGATNPFLHMGLHITILEQLSIDQPPGIRRLHRDLVVATGDPHAAEHRIMECLAEEIWRVTRFEKPFNPKGYLKCIKRLAGAGRPRG